MPTPNYNLPTITGNMTADVVRDMNALAVATDSALKGIGDGKADSTDLSQLQTQVTTHLNDMTRHNEFMNGAQKVRVVLGWNNTLNCPTMEYMEVV